MSINRTKPLIRTDHFYFEMGRIPKQIALQLIPFVKRIEIRAHYWDPNSVSAFEFARQMMSDRLKKANPALHVELIRLEKIETPRLHIEFLNGSVWDTDTSAIHAIDLRNEMYIRAEDVEDALEDLDSGMNLFLSITCSMQYNSTTFAIL